MAGEKPETWTQVEDTAIDLENDVNNVILSSVKNGATVGRVVANLLAAGFAVEVTGEHVPCTCCKGCPGTLLAKIEFTKPVSEATKTAKKAWSEKLEAAKNAAKLTLSEQLQEELEPLP